MKNLSLIIPAYNEEKSISQVVLEAKDFFEKCLEEFEIIVVDDCSNDNTGRLAAQAGAKVLRQPGNAGYGNALKAGILNARYDSIAICDADGTYDIQEFKKLLPLADKFDMVVGARKGKEFLGKGLKRPARWCQLLLVKFSTGYPVPDANSGMRIFTKKSALQFFDGICGGFSFTTSLTLAMHSTNRMITYVPILYRPRVGQSHVRLFRDTLASLQIIMQVMLRYNPIKAFMAISVFPLSLCLMSIIAMITALLGDNIFWAELSGISAIIWAFCAVLCFGIGMLAFTANHGPSTDIDPTPIEVFDPESN